MTEMVTAVLVPADTDQPLRIVKVPEFDSWNDLRRLIGGGYIEYPVRSSHFQVVADEEARVKSPPLPPNTRMNKLLGPQAEQYVAAITVQALNEDLSAGETIYHHAFDDQPKGLVCGDCVVIGLELPVTDDEGEYVDDRLLPLDDHVIQIMQHHLGVMIEGYTEGDSNA